MNIHPTAVVSEKAKLPDDLEVGPYAIVEADVVIGPRVKIYSHARIFDHTTIDSDCQIHMGAVLGHSPQIRAKHSSFGRLIVGQKNIFREYTTIHRSSQEGQATVIGDDNFFMAFSHIAHDCCIANHVTICNGALIAGHVHVEDYAFISGNVTAHQFCRIGKFSMVGGLTRVAKDVPPYMLVKGDSTVWAVNSVGLRRANFPLQSRNEIKKAFKLLYKSGLNVRQAIEELKKQDNSPVVNDLIQFILGSKRGICGHKAPTFWERLTYNAPIIDRNRVKAYKYFQENRLR